MLNLNVYHLIARSEYGLMMQILAGLITYIWMSIYCEEKYNPVKKIFESYFLKQEEIGASFAIYKEGKPLIDLHGGFKDKNSNNYSLDNVQLLCYNHYFLTVGDVFNTKEEKQIETQQEYNGTTEQVNWEVDDYHLQRLKELGLDGDDDDVITAPYIGNDCFNATTGTICTCEDLQDMSTNLSGNRVENAPRYIHNFGISFGLFSGVFPSWVFILIGSLIIIFLFSLFLTGFFLHYLRIWRILMAYIHCWH